MLSILTCSPNLTRPVMVKNSSRYKLFGPSGRGNEEVEGRLRELIGQMQTPENLRKLMSVITPETRQSPLVERKMDFSKFEEKLNKAKDEYFGKEPEGLEGNPDGNGF